GSASRITHTLPSSNTFRAVTRLSSGWPDRSAATSVTSVKATIGHTSGHPGRARPRARRQSPRTASAISAACASVIETPRPTTYAPSSPLRSRSSARLAAPTSSVGVGEAPVERLHEDLQVQEERPALDVVEVVLDPLFQRRVPAPAVHLRPARHAGFYLVAQ